MKSKIYLYSLVLFVLFLPFIVRYFLGIPYAFFSLTDIVSQSLLLDGIHILSLYIPQYVLYILVCIGIVFSIANLLKEYTLSSESFFFLVLFLIFMPAIVLLFLKLDASVITLPLVVYLFLRPNIYLYSILAILFPPGALVLALVSQNISHKRLIYTIVLIFGYLLHFMLGYNLFNSYALSFIELGQFGGISIFVFLCGLIGFSQCWEKSKFANFGPLLIIFLAFFVNGLYIYGAIMCAIYASIFVSKLYLTDWVNSYLKVSSIILLYLFVIIVFFSFVESTILQSPSLEDVRTYDKVTEHVFTHLGTVASPSTDVVIFSSRHTERTLATFLSSEIRYSYLLDETRQQIYDSLSLNQTLFELETSGVTHILITPQMKNGQIWNSSNQGLLFLLRDEKVFIRLTDQNFDLYYVNYSAYVPD
jgi:hypothetical protein